MELDEAHGVVMANFGLSSLVSPLLPVAFKRLSSVFGRNLKGEGKATVSLGRSLRRCCFCQGRRSRRSRVGDPAAA